MVRNKLAIPNFIKINPAVLNCIANVNIVRKWCIYIDYYLTEILI